MPVQHILPDIRLVLQLPGEIRTAVIFHHPVGELQLQILILQFIQVNAVYMEHPFCPLQDRGGKYLSHRDIHVCHAVFKDRLLLRVLQRMEPHLQIRPVSVSAKDMDIRSLIQRVDQGLLHLLIQFCVQGIDPDDLPEDLRVTFPYLWHRIGHDGKASLISRNILVGQGTLTAVESPDHFFLLPGKL